MRLSLGLVAVLSVALVHSATLKADQEDIEWWKNTVIYQIYPRSFKDSDGDGTGDLKGIESQLDYLADLGVETLWLSPIYKSPMKDFGYDISDFRAIDPVFGTMADFDSLLAKTHEKGMKLVMDFVPNHSSDEHEWFIKSVQREDPYTDYYVWADAKGFDDNGEPIPPNNWVSVFRYSMWEWREERQQFYLHQFVPGQPDLNYRNPSVLTEMKEVIRFWLQKGVDGFRQDAVAHIWEDDQMLDEPESGNPNAEDENDYGYYDHIYTNNLEGTRIVLGEFYSVFKEVGAMDGVPRVTMLEVYVGVEDQLKYYKVSDFPFNFGLLNVRGPPVQAVDAKREIDNILENIPNNYTFNWVFGNHDNWRLPDRIGGSELTDAFNLMAMSLPGVSINYYGEEIGMTNNMDITYEQTVDPSGCNCGPDRYNEEPCSRDPERTPMQWTSGFNAGFNAEGSAEPWLPVNANFQTLNVEAQQTDPDSHLNVFRAMAVLKRLEPTFTYGRAETKLDGDILSIARVQDEIFYGVYVTMVNFGAEAQTANIFQSFQPYLENAVVLISSTGSTGNNPVGTLLDLAAIALDPNEAIVIRLVAAAS
eukprot:maker-scaffold441_size170131-snap-gene-0.35 protein:Tk02649 transcript:maker-scaffold441_size170131-snap-gene-0.35-mRNA-1 annotation:"hypothetical protein LOTGIDRAFT_141370"